MPGAGSLRSVNYLYNAAPKDGSVIGTFSRDMPLLGIIGNTNARFDPLRFTWLGSSPSYGNDAYLLFTRLDASVKSIEDTRRPDGPPLVLGGTGDDDRGVPLKKLEEAHFPGHQRLEPAEHVRLAFCGIRIEE